MKGQKGFRAKINQEKDLRVRLAGLEPATHGLGNRCSIHLSYRRIRTYRLCRFGRRENRRGITRDFLHGFHPVLLRRVRISGYHLRIFPAPKFRKCFLRSPAHFHSDRPCMTQAMRRDPQEISTTASPIKGAFKTSQLPPGTVFSFSSGHKYPRPRSGSLQPQQGFQRNRVERHFAHFMSLREGRLYRQRPAQKVYFLPG
jgi:hypothetical protein